VGFAQQNASTAVRDYDIPAGPLTGALNRFGEEAGISISGNALLTEGKATTGLKGRVSAQDGLRKLLEGSGLEAVGEAGTGFSIQRAKGARGAGESTDTIQRKSAPATALPDLSAPEVTVIGVRPTDAGPLPGLMIDRDQIPGNIQSANKTELKESRALNIGDYMNSQMQGVSVNNYSGNPFQMDVNYRGFTASPEIGTPQGLSVFFDGVRVNEPFGDVVNWDLLPMNAIERFDLFPGSNPLFGLNTLGGAISLRSKSGFSSPGVEGQVLGGSFGRRQAQLSGGANNGVIAGFGALNLFDEDGWRDNSPSKLQQFFGRTDWRGQFGELTGTMLLADNKLIGNGLIPYELYQQRAESVFSSPDQTKNHLVQLALSGAFDVTDTMNITSQVYRRQSNRSGVNGDIYEGFQDFDSAHDFICDPADSTCVAHITRNGANQFGLINGQVNGPGVVAGTPIGLVTNTALHQTTDGLALQANWNEDRHKFMIGASVDRSRASYDMTQRLGLIDASHQVYVDPASIDPLYYAASHDIPGNNFSGTETTKSLYFNETWSMRPNLHFTAAARYNDTDTSSNLQVRRSAVNVDLHELRSGTLGLGNNLSLTEPVSEGFNYKSFNPMLGVNWLPVADLNLYGNLSQGARVPSVVELGCAFDSTPVPIFTSPDGSVVQTAPRSLRGPGCALPTTLSGDPFLPQIRSTSAEVGARGRFNRDWEWNASVYRTDLKDDIYFVGVGDGRSYFDTVGKTRRQGIELGTAGRVGLFTVKLGYAYTNATFESTFYTVSPYNSSADFNQNSQSASSSVALAGQNTLPSPTASANGGRGTYQMIRIDPGAKLPGIPEHTLNLNVSMKATTDLKLGLGMIARSYSYVRGNENNLHQPAGTDQQTGLYYCNSCAGGFSQTSVPPGRAFTTSGRVPGYAIFNFDADYDVNKQLSVFLQITNLFDRRYFTAGRLGVDPYSPSKNGAIGPSGWNYNSSEWLPTTFVGPGAPRGIWLGLNYSLGPK
jgi:outer membrane receptor protein involved in Fe transport